MARLGTGDTAPEKARLVAAGRRGLFLLALLVVLPAAGALERTLVLESGRDYYELHDATSYVEDPQAASGPAAAERLAFTPVDDPSMTFGFVSGAYWLKTTVRNDSHPESDWVLQIDYALLDYVDLYVTDESGRRVDHVASGDRRPFDSRNYGQRRMAFDVELPTGTTRQLLLRVQTESSLQVPLRLMTRSRLADQAYIGQFGLGLLYGVLLALFCYNLILFVSTRDATFFFYVLYVGSFGLIQLTLNGFSFQYFWPANPDWGNVVLPLQLSLAVLTMIQFCRSFLDLRRNLPVLDRIFKGIMLWFVLLAIAAFMFGYRLVIILQTASVFVVVFLIFLAAVGTHLRGFRPARYFLLAWFMLLLGIASYAAVSFGLLPKVFITEYGIQLGNAMEMILLSFALAYRMNLLKEENTRIARQAQESLEARVTERTVELNEALGNLARANEQLQDASHRDGLTGVFNRRFFDAALAEHFDARQALGNSLVLVMFDLDHFKEINDRRGHLAGDDALRTAAFVAAETLEKECLLARFGGEEFIIVRRGLNNLEAIDLAERLRRAVSDTRVTSGDQSFGLTASFGVRVVEPGENIDDPRTVVNEVDEALYAAKAAGRNRTAVWHEDGPRAV